MKKNFYLDILIFLFCLACVITGIQLDFHLFQGREEKILFTGIHRWTGYLFGAGLLLHLVWHAKWVAVASKQCIKK